MTEKAAPIRFLFCEAHGFRALIFDWDGVLLDSGRAYYLGYERVLQEAGISTTAREIYLREGQPTGQLLAQLFAERRIPVSDSMIQAMVERRREYQSAIGCKFFPDIWRLLSELHGAGYKLGMVTGSSLRSVELVLTKELASRFDVVITANDVKHPKPNPEPFRAAAEMLGLRSAQCLVVENAPFGIEAAHRAGCPVIAICTTLSSEDLQQADWIVPDHGALELLLASGAESAAQFRPAGLISSRSAGCCAASLQGQNHGNH
jgi:beta-phosphoglucomutase